MSGLLLVKDRLQFDSSERPPSDKVMGGCLQEVLPYFFLFFIEVFTTRSE